jgi:hypothetical protein
LGIPVALLYKVQSTICTEESLPNEEDNKTYTYIQAKLFDKSQKAFESHS